MEKKEIIYSHKISVYIIDIDENIELTNLVYSLYNILLYNVLYNYKQNKI